MKAMAQRLMLMVARGVLRRVSDGDKLQVLQATFLEGETRDGLERVQQYGFTAHPHPGAELVSLFLGGNRDHGLVIAVDDRRYRIKGLAQGEVALYDDLGNVIKLGRSKIAVNAVTHLEATAPTCHITATTTHDGNVTINGNLAVKGSITSTDDISAAGQVSDGTGSMADMRSTYNGHDHDENDNGGPTDSPNQPMS